MNKNAGLMFLARWLKSPITVASITPSSDHLAKAMAGCLPPGDGLIVELGGGTGPITQALRQATDDPGKLVVIERDKQFFDFLRERFPDITVVCGDAMQMLSLIQPLSATTPVRAVVSGLPLLSMSASVQKTLVEQALALTGQRGPFIQFSYGLHSPVKKHVAKDLNLSATCAAQVWRNVPPARVWVYQNTAVEKRLPESLLERRRAHLSSRVI